MKTIVTVCGQGLGSSLIVEINTKQVLDELGLSNEFEVTHENLNTYTPGQYDYVICGEDLADNVDAGSGTKIVLTNLMDNNELKTKLTTALKIG